MELKTGLKRGDQVFTQKCKKDLQLSKDPQAKKQKWIYSLENKEIITENDYKCLDLFSSSNILYYGTNECDGRESQIFEYDEEEHTFKSMGKCLSTAKTIEQTEVWAGNLSDGSLAVLLLNRASYQEYVEITWKELGLNYSIASLRDLWAKKDLEPAIDGYKVKLKSHESLFLKVSEPEPEPEPTPSDSDNQEDEDDENNTLIFVLTIGSLVLVIGFIFFVICYIKIKREKIGKTQESDVEDNPDNLNGKLVRNTTDTQN